MIVQELHRIQERYRYLPAEELTALAQRSRTPLHRIHEVASFYPLYRLQPPAAVEVRVCRDMACFLQNSPRFQRSLEELAQTKGAGQVKVEGASCLGQCDHPVAVSINGHIYHGLPEATIRAHVERALTGEPLPPPRSDRTPLGWKIDPYYGQPRYESVKQFLANPDADAVLQALEVANLRGMGGAGFPTFRKWATVRGIAADRKYVICNADESEPGTFKDRELLRRLPYLVIEGMVLAGLVTGATQGYVYIRHEYEEERVALEEALAHARREAVCGDNVLGSGKAFALDVFVSPGGYIQGEESALLEAMEDRRGEPRNKPPFPVHSGLYGKPTVINNVETLAWVPSIVRHGGAWYRDLGVRGATGMRFVSVSGDVNRPGVYEVPFGQTVRELVFDTAGGVSAGQKLKAIATSGPSGGFLPAVIRAKYLPDKFVQERLPGGATTFDVLELALDFHTLAALGGMLGAAFVVYGDQRDMVEQALNSTQFFRNESCGKCVPCRIGSQKLSDIIQAILTRRFPPGQLGVVHELGAAMTATSICGLGQVAANPMLSVLRHFPEDLEKYLDRSP